MQYVRTIGDDNIVYISTLDKDRNGNITKEEYDKIRDMYKNAKPGYVVVFDGKEYSYMQIDDPSKDSMTPDDVWKVIEKSNISKEDKEKLKEFICGKEEK